MNPLSKLNQLSQGMFKSPNVSKQPRYMVIHHKSKKVVIVTSTKELAERRANELIQKEKQIYIVKKDGSNESM